MVFHEIESSARSTPPHPACAPRKLRVSRHRQCGSALVVAVATPFLLTDVFDLTRDVFYGVYALVVAALFAGWARSTG